MTMTYTIRFLLVITLPLTSGAFSTVVRPHVQPDTRKRRSSAFSPTQSLFVLQADALLNDDRRERNSQKRKALWPRRIWSKIVRRQSSRSDSPSPLRMQAIDQETEAQVQPISSHYDEDFILRNFGELTPDMVLPKVSPSDVDSEFFDVAITPSSGAALSPVEKQAARNISLARCTGMIFENILTGLIKRNAVDTPENLSVKAFPRGNPVARLLRGRFSTDAKVEVGRLVFPAIRMSSGTLEVKRLTLNVMGFLQNMGILPSQQRGTSRFPEQFDLHADDWTFSRHDLLFSPCIRNGLQRLLVRILRDRGVQSSTIKVTSLDILPSGKISIKGEAKTLFDSPLSFEVRSGISSSCRGHVLTFPGLEVSLSRDLGLFVPVVPNLDLDVGHNARFGRIEIDGKRRHLRLSACVTITPKKTIQLNDYVQSSEAFSAKFSTDVGQWLTRIGNFTN